MSSSLASTDGFDSHDETCCFALASLHTMKHQSKSGWKFDLLWFDSVMVSESAGLFVFWLNTQVLSNCVHYWVWSSWWIWKRSPHSFEYMSLRCLIFDLHPTTNRSNIGVHLRKGTLTTHMCLDRVGAEVCGKWIHEHDPSKGYYLMWFSSWRDFAQCWRIWQTNCWIEYEIV